MQDPQINLTEIEAAYSNGDYLTKNPTWHIEDSPWKAAQVLKIMQQHSLRPSTVCEIGCGAGEILRELALKMPGTGFYGYEVSEDAYKFCMTRQTDQLRFTLGNLLDEHNTDFFDLMLVMDVFEHVDDYYGFLRKCRSKATYKIFHIPLDISVLSLLRKHTLLKTRELYGHIQYFTKDTALATLKDAGYDIIHSFYTGSSVDRPAKSFAGQLAKIPRKLLFSLNQDFTVKTLGGYSLLVLAK